MMDKDQKNTLRKMLEEELTSLNNRLVDNKHHGLENSMVHESLGELSSYDNHPADHGSEMFEREKDLALNDKDEHHRDDLEDALKRMDDGTYGKCLTCGEEIPYERLLAVPDTAYCIEHSKEQSISQRRPVEEEILDPTFSGTNPNKGDEEVIFDGADAWHDVEQYGTSNPPDFFREGRSYNDLTIEDQENIREERGYVQGVEGFIATDMDGGAGEDAEVVINDAYEDYVSDLEAEERMENMNRAEMNEPNLGLTDDDSYVTEEDRDDLRFINKRDK